MRMMTDDGHALVIRAIRAALADEGNQASEPPFVIEAITTRDFASSMFVGKQHHLALRLDGYSKAVKCRAERLAQSLPDVDLAVGKYFLAEARVQRAHFKSAGRTSRAEIEVEALTLES